MTDEEIVTYCRKLITANLSQYTDSNIGLLAELYAISDTSNDDILRQHCVGLKSLLEKCIEILEGKNESK